MRYSGNQRTHRVRNAVWILVGLYGLGCLAGPTARTQGLGSIIAGDLNNDGRVTVVDGVLALKSVVQQIALTSEQLRTADVNGDGRVDITDVILILRKAVSISIGNPG